MAVLFPRAVHAEKGEQAPPPDGKGNPLHRAHLPVRFFEIFHLNDVFRHSSSVFLFLNYIFSIT